MRKTNRLETLRHALATLRDEAEPPAHLVAAAIALHGSALPSAEVFVLRAAASVEDHQGLVCASQSGLWTLRTFVGESAEDRAAGRGQVLLRVHPDHSPSYEGRTARIYVTTPEGERVLAEAVVRDGEVYADIILTGLDLYRRDAVNVVFGPAVSP
jgi:hypothetical protein